MPDDHPDPPTTRDEVEISRRLRETAEIERQRATALRLDLHTAVQIARERRKARDARATPTTKPENT